MRRSKPVRIGELWRGFVDENPMVARKLCEARIPDVWCQVAGRGIATLTAGMDMKNGILHVRMSSSAARQEVFMQREQLKDEINKKIGMPVVRSIIVK